MNNMNKTVFNTVISAAAVAAALMLSSCSKSEKNIPVSQIEMPDKIELFTDQTMAVSISTLPANATNAGELQVTTSNPDIATFENGKITGIKAGSTTLTAICGAVRETAKIKVLWPMTLNGRTYPVKSASGYKYFMGSPEVDSYDVEFTDGSNRLRIWIPAKLLGKTIDISKPLPALTQDWDVCFVSAVFNSNEKSYGIWLQKDSDPIIRDNMWETLSIYPSGTFSLNLLPKIGYVAEVNIRLTDGQNWQLHYEGPIQTEEQGEKN